jgi:hypothetical protein
MELIHVHVQLAHDGIFSIVGRHSHRTLHIGTQHSSHELHSIQHSCIDGTSKSRRHWPLKLIQQIKKDLQK